MPKARSVSKRFWEKVLKGKKCWHWKAGKIPKGYGVFNVGPPWKHVYAHRMSYTLTRGKIPKGLFVLHRCDNPSCVKPTHLFLGTALDNSADMRAKKRSATGEKNGVAKLSAREVKAIKKGFVRGERNKDLAKKFRVGKPQISRIVHGQRWQHLETACG